MDESGGLRTRVKRWLNALPSKAAAVSVAGLAVVAVVLGGVSYAVVAAPALPRLQLAGSAGEAQKIVCAARAGCLPEPFRDALQGDFWLIAGYTVGLVLLASLGTTCFQRTWTRGLARAARWGAFIGGCLDVVENIAVLRGLPRLAEASSSDLPWAVAATADVLKLSVLVPTVVVALAALGVVIRRSSSEGSTPIPKGDLIGPSGDERPGTLREQVHLPYKNPDETVVEGRLRRKVGICVSGGGIRSATVTLGALQVLRAHDWLREDGYLFSVSGGGYLSGALQLAMQPPHAPAGRALPAFEDGTPELRYLRRHGNYIADGAKEWAAALATVVGNLLYSLTLLASAAAALGLLLGLLYATFPVAAPWFPGAFDPAPTPATSAAPWALLVVSVPTVVLWVATGAHRARKGVPSPKLRAATGAAAGVTLLVLALTTVIPALAKYLSLTAVTAWFADADAQSTVATTGGAGTLLVTIATALLGMLSRRSTGSGQGKAGFAAELMRQAVVLAVIALLVLVWVVVMATTLRAVVAYGGSDLDLRAALAAVVVVVVVAGLAAWFFDQTAASLHPFYRQRLSTAFAVRRVGDFAEPYDYKDPTTLVPFAAKVPGLPQVVFVAAAQRSADASTAPGRGALPYTFAADWVGGPEVGYVRTQALIDRVPESYQADLTVLGAMALSGAAFASAMGRASGPFQVFFAISNARLGAWLPNPAWLRAEEKSRETWTHRRLPPWRRESYHLREILGLYSRQDPLLLVTDGGHYDNLGLVEALRHECATVVVVDSSGGEPAFADALASAMTLAREALGVTITLDDTAGIVPGSQRGPEPPEPLRGLHDRFARSAVVTGRISYHGGATGTLVVAKTRLLPDLPYGVLTYAAAHPTFPDDSTADQWFDHDQFEAYHLLGRHIGTKAVEALVRLTAAGARDELTGSCKPPRIDCSATGDDRSPTTDGDDDEASTSVRARGGDGRRGGDPAVAADGDGGVGPRR